MSNYKLVIILTRSLSILLWVPEVYYFYGSRKKVVGVNCGHLDGRHAASFKEHLCQISSKNYVFDFFNFVALSTVFVRGLRPALYSKDGFWGQFEDRDPIWGQIWFSECGHNTCGLVSHPWAIHGQGAVLARIFQRQINFWLANFYAISGIT